MAIQSENVSISGNDFIYTYSDEGYYIKQEETGKIYVSAYDLIEYPHTYTETKEKYPEWQNKQDEIYAEIGRKVMKDEKAVEYLKSIKIDVSNIKTERRN